MWILNEATQCRSECLDITWFDDQSSPIVLNNIRKRPHRRTNNGDAVSQGLNHRHRKIFAMEAPEYWPHATVPQPALNRPNLAPIYDRQDPLAQPALVSFTAPSSASVALQPDFEPRLD